jgi:hypothetical protein
MGVGMDKGAVCEDDVKVCGGIAGPAFVGGVVSDSPYGKTCQS